MTTLNELVEIVQESLEDSKAREITHLDVHELTTITDRMMICSGTSSRHVKSIASNLVKDIKARHLGPCTIEGENEGEWVLIDLGDIIVHIMLPPVREFYDLERLWSVPAANDEDDAAARTTPKSSQNRAHRPKD